MLGSAEFPSVCLDRIFDHLPLQDLLYTVPQVCVQWRESHPFACHRRALTLQPLILAQTRENYELNTRENPLGPDYEFMNLVTNDDGSRYLGPKRIHLFEMQGVEWNAKAEEHCERLTELFPGITHLVCVYTGLALNMEPGTNIFNEKHQGSSQIDRLTDLLQLEVQGSWSESLKSLEIHYNTNSQKQWNNDVEYGLFMGQKQQEATSWVRLIRVINALPNLRSLTLKVWPSTFLGRITCQLSILNQLEHFTCDSKNFFWESQPNEWIDALIESIRRFAPTNPALQTITLGDKNYVNFVDPGDPRYIMNLNPELCSRFTELNLQNYLFSEAVQMLHHQGDIMPQFTLFCRQFDSLTHLTFVLGVCTLRELMEGLVHLRQLVHLDMTLLLTDAGQLMPIEGRDDPFPPAMPSVRCIKFFSGNAFKCHTDVAKFQFERLFPNLQVFVFSETRDQCWACARDAIRIEPSDSIRERVAECNRLSRAPFKKFEKLKLLYYSSTFGKLFQNDRPYESNEPFKLSFTWDEL